MHPILFHVGPFTVYTYGVMMATAVLVGLWLARRSAAAKGLDADRVWNLGIYVVLAGLAGAKLWYVAVNWDYYWANPREIFAFSTLQSGGVFYGGFFAALVVVLLYAHYRRIALLPVLDVFSPSVALGLAFARVGCFSAGCCYGKPTRVPWAVTFTNPFAGQLVGTPLGVALHPTQVYEMVADLAIFAYLFWLNKRQRFAGQIFGGFAILYGIARGTIEFFRGDPDRTLLFGGAFSLMQVISLGLIFVGAWLWWRGAAQPAPAPARR